MLQASSKVKGITIEIGADTTSFGYAMKQIKQEASMVAKDLKNVDNAMAFDSNNIEKAADKLKLLREASDNAAKKVETIRKAIDALNKEYADKSSEEYKKQLDFLTRSLESATREQEIANARLKDFETNANAAGEGALSLGNIIKGNLISTAIQKGFSTIINLAKTLARELVNAGKKIAEFSWSAIKEAATYSDQLEYSETVFGEFGDSATEWAKDNSVALRIAKKDLTEYMNMLGQVFHTQGLSEEESLEKVENLMSLAADIRAATGKDIGEILPTMMRGFTTSVRNFKQFGVIMTDAEVKAYALANGLVEVTVNENDLAKATANLHDKQQKAQKAFDKYGEDSVEYEKALVALNKAEEEFDETLGGEAETMDSATIITARYMLLLERLANIIGQNVKEQNLFNSQWEKTKTIFKNFKTDAGMGMLDVATNLLKSFNEFLESENGQALLEQMVNQFKEWAKTIEEMVEDGRFEQFIQKLIDKLPQIIEDVGDLVESFIKGIPTIQGIADGFLGLVGSVDKLHLSQAWAKAENKVQAFAEKWNMNINTVKDATAAYALQTDQDLADVYNKWEEYEPLIIEYMTQIGAEAENMEETTRNALDELPVSVQRAINNTENTDLSPFQRLAARVWEIANNILAGVDYAGNPINDGPWKNNNIFGFDKGLHSSGGGSSRALGGPAEVGQLLRVNDDAGHRTEMFIPSVPGTILSGQQTDKVINNNNQRTYGAMNIYINSYGTNASEIANEIGYEVNRKLRMSGAML